MKVEKWKYKGEVVDVNIFEDDEIEKNEDIEDMDNLELENTVDIKEKLKEFEEEHE